MADLKSLIDKLIPSPNSSTYFNVEDISPSVLSSYADQSDDYWKALLNYLQDEDAADKLNHYLIRNGDLLRKDSLFNYIQSFADLNEEAFNQYFNAIKSYKISGTDLTDYNFWNESVANLVEFFIDHFDFDYITTLEDIGYTETNDGATIPNGAITTNGVKFRIKDVQNADAGRSFTSSENGRWVRQWHNIDGESYGKVRGSDKILSVLGNSSNMQFTRKTGAKKWIRLLMPAYKRNVEVEDLNRNFWVIGQTLTALCAYVFDDSNPLNELIKNIMGEIVQLWENILYLWAAIMLASQKPYYTKVHQEVIYLPVNEFQPYLKYDNFIESNSSDSVIWNKVDKRLEYLKSQYPECHLAIVPVLRQQGYYHNYYGAERWLGVWFYNRNTGETSHVQFSNSILSANDFASNSAALRMNENSLTVQYLYPFSKINTYQTSSTLRFYQALRVVPISFIASFDTINNTLSLKSLIIAIYDMGRVIRRLSETSIVGYRWDSTGTRSTVDSYTHSHLADQSTILEINPACGYYLGELISASNVTKVPVIPDPDDFEIHFQELLLPPIGSAISGPMSNNNHGGYLASSRWTVPTKTKLRNFNNKLLQLFPTPEERYIYIYLGKNRVDLHSDSADYNASGDVIHTGEMSGYWFPNTSTTLKKQDEYSNNFIDLEKLYSSINDSTTSAYDNYRDILATDNVSEDRKFYTRSRQSVGMGAIISIPGHQKYVFPNYQRENFYLPLKEEKYKEYKGGREQDNYYKNLADIIFKVDTTDNYEADGSFVPNGSVHYGRLGFTYTKSKIYRKNEDETLKADNWFIIYEVATGTYIRSNGQIDEGIPKPTTSDANTDGEYTSFIQNDDALQSELENFPIFGFSRYYKRKGSHLKFNKDERTGVYIGYLDGNIKLPDKFLPIITDVHLCIFRPLSDGTCTCYQTIKSKIYYEPASDINSERHLTHNLDDGKYPFITHTTLTMAAKSFLGTAQTNYSRIGTTISYSANSYKDYDISGTVQEHNYPTDVDLKFHMLDDCFSDFDRDD